MFYLEKDVLGIRIQPGTYCGCGGDLFVFRTCIIHNGFRRIMGPAVSINYEISILCLRAKWVYYTCTYVTINWIAKCAFYLNILRWSVPNMSHYRGNSYTCLFRNNTGVENVKARAGWRKNILTWLPLFLFMSDNGYRKNRV